MVNNTNEVTYGFVNEDNILIEFAVFIDGDIETIDRVKNEYNAYSYYKMNLEKEVASIGEAYWNGSRFLLPSPYPSWIWDEESNMWIPPIPLPQDGKSYVWNEELESWIEFNIPE